MKQRFPYQIAGFGKKEEKNGMKQKGRNKRKERAAKFKEWKEERKCLCSDNFCFTMHALTSNIQHANAACRPIGVC